MRRYIIASHGSLSKGIVDSASMIVGALENVEYVSITPNDSQDSVKQQIEALIRLNGEDVETVVLTDLLGGSVTNTFLEYIPYQNLHVITGVNLPMALEILVSDEGENLQAVIQDSIEKGKAGIVYVNQLV
ncbi:UNVERIFIED_CONTAM: mannose/fructose-specific phosphotransferase system component IIA [Brevibacillus sp. OAP136]